MSSKNPPNLKKNSKHYFTKVHENAILEYTKSDCQDRRNELYESLIGPALQEMVEKIIFTYKFTNLQNIQYLKEDCIIWLTTILDKYDATRGSKAFSYFSVITKNWFIQKTKKQAKRIKKEVPLEDIVRDNELESVVTYNEYHNIRETKEFWYYLMNEIESWQVEDMKPNERKVLQAVQILLEDPESVPIFNKKAIYLYLREITGLNTKQIVNYLNKMRVRYREFKESWDQGEI